MQKIANLHDEMQLWIRFDDRSIGSVVAVQKWKELTTRALKRDIKPNQNTSARRNEITGMRCGTPEG